MTEGLWRVALALATGLTLVACAGDVNGGPTGPDEDASTEPRLDAGGTSTLMDAGGDGSLRDARPESDGARPDDAAQTLGLDAGDAGDAALAAALSSDGVDASLERATLVSQASCDRAAACEGPAADPDCTSGRLAMFQSQLAMGWPTSCLDAMLDFFGCSTSLPTCDAFAAGCPDKLAIYMTACADQLASP